MTLLFKTDWLASRPVFYNTKTKIVSYNVNDVIDFNDIEFHPEGLSNYLEWGYSVLEQTPLKHVKFLPPNSELHCTVSGDLMIKQLPDPVDDLLDFHLSESDIIDMIQEKLINWEKKIEGNITIPLSGGHDSRLLTYLMPDKSKLQAYTYGTSPRQEESYEVIIAKTLCKKLNVQWKQIKLGEYHKYFDDWNQVFGISTHAHGMYHIEFYKKIIQLSKFNSHHLLSGLGGTWAGSVSVPEIKTMKELIYLRYSYGMYATNRCSKIKSNDDLKAEYFLQNQERFRDSRLRKIERMRIKMIYLSYLIRIPESLGIKAWSPFLDIKIAIAMQNLPLSRRTNKVWLTDFFQKAGIDYSQISKTANRKNTLNYQAIRTLKPTYLSVSNFQTFISPEYISWINNSLKHHGNLENSFWKFVGLSKINRIFKIANIVDQRKSAYFAYLTLKPFEYLFHKTNE